LGAAVTGLCSSTSSPNLGSTVQPTMRTRTDKTALTLKTGQEIFTNHQ